MKISSHVLLLLIAALLATGCGRQTTATQPVRKDITETIFASGTLEPEDKYHLTAQTDGYLVALYFDEGDTVHPGQILAVIENQPNNISAQSAAELFDIAAYNISPEAPALKQATLNIQLAKEKAQQDSLQAARYEKLMQSHSVSKLEWETAQLAHKSSQTALQAAWQNFQLLQQQAEQQLIMQRAQSRVNSVMSGNNAIKAILGGRVYKRHKQLGDYVKKADVIAMIGNAHELYAELSIDESNIAKIKIGQQAVIQLNIVKEKVYHGEVAAIDPAFDEAAQSFACKVRFTENLDFKISGTQLQANIILGSKQNVLVIPKKYLGYGNKVSLQNGERVIVSTGFVSNEWVEILAGLDEHATIVAEHADEL